MQVYQAIHTLSHVTNIFLRVLFMYKSIFQVHPRDMTTFFTAKRHVLRTYKTYALMLALTSDSPASHFNFLNFFLQPSKLTICPLHTPVAFIASFIFTFNCSSIILIVSSLDSFLIRGGLWLSVITSILRPVKCFAYSKVIIASP